MTGGGLLFRFDAAKLDTHLLTLANENCEGGPWATIADASGAPAFNLRDAVTFFMPGWKEQALPAHYGPVTRQLWALVYGAFWGERSCVDGPVAFPGKGVKVADMFEPPGTDAGRAYLTVQASQGDPVLVRIPYAFGSLVERPSTFGQSRDELHRGLAALVDRVNLVLPAARLLA